MQFTRDLHAGISAGTVTLTVRRWSRAQAKVGGHYRAGDVTVEVDDIELLPFAALTAADVRRTGCGSRAALRALAAHSGPIADDTPVYRIEFHVVEGPRP